ncbi:MAG: GNAT family N-acetyltransferase, partial [Aeoliella sp.]
FFWEGMKQTTRYTYVFDDLSDSSSLKQGMAERCKRMLKKAEKLGVQAVETDDLRLMFDVNQQTFERQNRSFPYSYELVARIDDACRTHAGRRILISKDEQGEIHSCDYMVYDEQCAISLLQGANPKFRDSGAQRFLDWNSINFAATVSKKFDFEGSMIPGIEVYNREFGARPAPYYEITGKKSRVDSKTMSARWRKKLSQTLRKLATIVEP